MPGGTMQALSLVEAALGKNGRRPRQPRRRAADQGSDERFPDVLVMVIMIEVESSEGFGDSIELLVKAHWLGRASGSSRLGSNVSTAH